MQPLMSLNARSVRKALMDQHGVTYADIAAEVPCSVGLVAHTFSDRARYETPKSKRIKQVFADRVGMSVAELWPEAAA
jgi:hypothetical protein